MRIGMILDSTFPPDPRVENEATALVKAGHEVFLFCLDYSGELPREENYRGIQVRRYKTFKWMYSLSSLAYSASLYHQLLKPLIRDFLREKRVDIVHIHDIQVARAVFTISRKLGVKTVLDLHENRPEIMKHYDHVRTFPGKLLIFPSCWRKFEYKYIGEADHVIVVTPEAKQFYIEETGEPEAKFHVVPNTVLPSFYKKYAKDTSIIDKYKESVGILYIGDTGLRRGLETAIRGMKYILPDQPDARLIIVGRSKADNILMDLAEKEGVVDSVYFEGWQDMEKFPSFIVASKIGICPIHRNLHHNTTYANKLFQYLAFGLPIVVSNCDAQEHLAKDYKIGEVFNDRDAQDFANKVLMLAKDEARYRRYSNNAVQAIEQELNWDVFCKELINIYDVEKDRSEQQLS